MTWNHTVCILAKIQFPNFNTCPMVCYTLLPRARWVKVFRYLRTQRSAYWDFSLFLDIEFPPKWFPHRSACLQGTCIAQHLLKLALVNKVPQKLLSPAFNFHKNRGVHLLVELVMVGMSLKTLPLHPLRGYLPCLPTTFNQLWKWGPSISASRSLEVLLCATIWEY